MMLLTAQNIFCYACNKNLQNLTLNIDDKRLDHSMFALSNSSSMLQPAVSD